MKIKINEVIWLYCIPGGFGDSGRAGSDAEERCSGLEDRAGGAVIAAATEAPGKANPFEFAFALELAAAYPLEADVVVVVAGGEVDTAEAAAVAEEAEEEGRTNLEPSKSASFSSYSRPSPACFCSAPIHSSLSSLRAKKNTRRVDWPPSFMQKISNAFFSCALVAMKGWETESECVSSSHFDNLCG